LLPNDLIPSRVSYHRLSHQKPTLRFPPTIILQQADLASIVVTAARPVSGERAGQIKSTNFVVQWTKM
jgi:hypothetical protein